MEERRSMTKIFETELSEGNDHIAMFYTNMSKFLKSRESEEHREVVKPIQENINHARRLLETFEVYDFRYSVCVRYKDKNHRGLSKKNT